MIFMFVSLDKYDTRIDGRIMQVYQSIY